MNNIAHISTVHIRTDTRIYYKEVQSLSKHYNVLMIVADGLGNSITDYCEILDLGLPKNRTARILFFGLKSIRLLKSKNIDIVHIHDPELIIVGLLLKIKGYKVVYDIHELVYKSIKDKSWITFKRVRFIIALIYRYIEGIALRFFDKIILAEDGYKDFYDSEYPKRISKYTYIRNYPIISMFSKNNKEIINSFSKENNIIYLGAISEERGVFELIESMNYLDDSFKLYIIGKWRSNLLLEKCQNSLGWNKVEMLGYIEPHKIGEYIKNSKLGMCTLHKIDNYAYTTPVKSFEYLINGLPLIMTDFPFWQKFYKDVALFVDPKDPKKISEAIYNIINDPKKYDKLSKNSVNLALKHTWDSEEKKLFKLYSDLILEK
jgi:glycosyltransferase involved in cell wall biosynthesis